MKRMLSSALAEIEEENAEMLVAQCDALEGDDDHARQMACARIRLVAANQRSLARDLRSGALTVR